MAELTFNRLYHLRRRAAASRGEKFPSYQTARKRLNEAGGAAKCAGGATPKEFWDTVFAAAPSDRRELDDRALGREALALAQSGLRGGVPCDTCGELVDVGCHSRGGMLCRTCANIAYVSDDDADLLRKIAAYLEKTS